MYVQHIFRLIDPSPHQRSPLLNTPQKSQWVWQYGQRTVWNKEKIQVSTMGKVVQAEVYQYKFIEPLLDSMS